LNIHTHHWAKMYSRNKQKHSDFPDDEAILKATMDDNISMTLAQHIPEEYLSDPLGAAPKLDNLRSVLIQQAENDDKEILSPKNDSFESLDIAMSGGGGGGRNKKERKDNAITDILNAAEKDVDVHLSRIKAVLSRDPSLLDTYTLKNDPLLQECVTQLDSMQQKRNELQSKSMEILKSLSQNIEPSEESGLTKNDVQQARLSAWEKALEWYIYCPPDNNTSESSGTSSSGGGSLSSKSKNNRSSNKPSLTLHQLLQHLSVTSITKEGETRTTALEKASQMCSTHLESASLLLSDASENTGITYEAYAIHLMAHSMAAQGTLRRSETIQNQFLMHGREALKIGSALEMAEAKRRQSDNASLLIRLWWMMENLAEQEEQSSNPINVDEEVRGVISSSSCRMDPLFTLKENSVEAARALKSLRMVVRCRSTSNSSNIGSDIGGAVDPHASKRFELTDRLIQRTSKSLESRLLNEFSEIYCTGGTYDFTSIKAARRIGRLDWLTLRELAEALMNFDSGRSLHKKYVELVVSTKFPELFNDKGMFTPTKGDGEQKQEFDVDATRSKLSNLFHRVCEVCTDEFKLIAHAFSPTLPPHLQDVISSKGKSNYPSSFLETYPLQVARALLQRVISDRNYGMQAQIHELLESIDQKGDSASGAKKLDTFVVIHEKAAGLFTRLKDAAQKMWGTGVSAYGKTDMNRR
jgi:hypothetical protein